MSDSSIQLISSALGVPLAKEFGRVSGGGVVSFPGEGPLPTITFNITPLKAVFGEQVFVLFSVSGDLHLVVSHYPKTGALSVFFLDALKVKPVGGRAEIINTIIEAGGLLFVVNRLKKAIVVAFYHSGTSWKPVAL